MRRRPQRATVGRCLQKGKVRLQNPTEALRAPDHRGLHDLLWRLGDLSVHSGRASRLEVGIGKCCGVDCCCLHGVVSTALRYGVWHWGISRLGADRVLVYQYLITLTGVVSSIVVLREGFGLIKVLGAVVLLAGVYIAHRR